MNIHMISKHIIELTRTKKRLLLRMTNYYIFQSLSIADKLSLTITHVVTSSIS